MLFCVDRGGAARLLNGRLGELHYWTIAAACAHLNRLWVGLGGCVEKYRWRAAAECSFLALSLCTPVPPKSNLGLRLVRCIL
jgi:hypothetical protein